ncbi:MAG: tyrosine--tRNA ligase [Deltaproteobacteria bacterium]|nr:tyrosine--tRNA ligase [Deltaproteobacteria bacterium]
MSYTPKEQIAILSRGVQEFFSPADLEKKLLKKKQLRVKLGLDPTIADIHLGHTVVLQKLRQFQDLGHEVIFLIGDFTAQIGDPSGRSKTRPMLTAKEVKENSRTYLTQAFKILDKKKTKVHFNSEWLGKLRAMELIQLGAKQTVARMLERLDFKERFKEGQDISVYEFYYPLLQAYDSVALKADVELGGLDQKFNLLLARQVQERYGQEPEVVILLPLLVGTDGVKKMSKSFNNYVGITEKPKEIFGKIMSLTDEGMHHYYELLTSEDMTRIRGMHPKEAKVHLGKLLVRRYYSEKEADQAAKEFEEIFAKGGRPENIEEVQLTQLSEKLVDILPEAGLATSKSEARRLVQQNAVRLDDVRVTDMEQRLEKGKSYLVQVGKRKFKRVTLK